MLQCFTNCDRFSAVRDTWIDVPIVDLALSRVRLAHGRGPKTSRTASR